MRNPLSLCGVYVHRQWSAMWLPSSRGLPARQPGQLTPMGSTSGNLHLPTRVCLGSYFETPLRHILHFRISLGTAASSAVASPSTPGKPGLDQSTAQSDPVGPAHAGAWSTRSSGLPPIGQEPSGQAGSVPKSGCNSLAFIQPRAKRPSTPASVSRICKYRCRRGKTAMPGLRSRTILVSCICTFLSSSFGVPYQAKSAKSATR